jgi:hypothetical protein
MQGPFVANQLINYLRPPWIASMAAENLSLSFPFTHFLSTFSLSISAGSFKPWI